MEWLFIVRNVIYMKKLLWFGVVVIVVVVMFLFVLCGFGGLFGDSGGEEGFIIFDLFVFSYFDGIKVNWEIVIDGFEKVNFDIKVEFEV